MELRTLTYFKAVAEAGSVSAAADIVHVTQPAISRQLRQLENELGVELFVRTAGPLRLSAAGRQFLPYATDVLQRADGARAAAKSFAAGRLESLTIAAPTTTLTDVIAPFLATFGPDDPMPTVIESGAREAYEALGTAADLAIVTELPLPPMEHRALAVLPLWAYVRQGHRWASRNEIPIADLAGEPLLTLQRTFKPRQLLESALERAKLNAEQIIECSNPQVAQALAAAGRGLAVVTDDPRFELTPLHIVGAEGRLAIELFAAWDPQHHAASALSSIAQRLGQFCVIRYGVEVTPPTRP
jgi:DNA-binding transcriptional LysR family regulator